MWICLKDSLRSCLRLRIHLGEIGTAVWHDVEEVVRSRKAVEKLKTNFNVISLMLIVVGRPGGLLPPTVQECRQILYLCFQSDFTFACQLPGVVSEVSNQVPEVVCATSLTTSALP